MAIPYKVVTQLREQQFLRDRGIQSFRIMNYVSFVAVVAAALFCLSAVGAQEETESRCSATEGVYRCGRRCEERCNVPAPRICRGLHCHDKGRRCRPGFAREQHSNRCVALEDCPETGCAVGEFKGACGRTCEGTCESPKTPEICSRIRCGEWRCRCDLSGGYVRNKRGKCVHVSQCPEYS